jgi:hypothetical protein
MKPPCPVLHLLRSESVKGFGRRPAHKLSNTHRGRSAGVRKPPVKETAGEWAPYQRALWGLVCADRVAQVSQMRRCCRWLVRDSAAS